MNTSEASPQTDEVVLGWHHRRVTPALSGGTDDAKPQRLSIATILRDHVSLSTSCIDRLYLNGYVPNGYVPITPNGMRAAFLYTTLYRRLRRPHRTIPASPYEFPSPLDAALRHLDTVLQDLWSSPKPTA